MSDIAIAACAWGVLLVGVIGVGVMVARLPGDIEQTIHDAEQHDRNGGPV